MNVKRLRQVLRYGWLHAGEIATLEKKKTLYRIRIYLDIMYCFMTYKMWSNQYLKEKFYLLSSDDRIKIGGKYREDGIKRDEWQKEFIKNRKFLIKYSNIKYELSHLRDARNRAYAKQFSAGKNLSVEYDVNISRQHYLDGNIRIGDNVLLAKHVFIDYSGGIIIKDNVVMANGVIIETHHHANHSDYTQSHTRIIPSLLTVEDGAMIGSRAIILSTCRYIGKNARIGAGSVVTKDVPDKAIVVGSPAKVIRVMD